MKSYLVAAGAVIVVALASTAAAAPVPVTIDAQSSVVSLAPSPYVKLFGSVASRKAGEVVTIQAKECGLPGAFFRGVASARTAEGGGWSTDAWIRTTTIFRATWADATSSEVRVRVRASVSLSRLAARKFRASVGGIGNFWRKSVVIQRFNRQLGTWVRLRSVVLSEPGYSGAGLATFTLSVSKGTLIRAFFPLAQARPCYLPGVSKLVRT
jgi:hypothetical protein